jgi:hypothetical protein
MKRSIGFVIVGMLLLTACRKADLQQPPVDEAVWLQKERGVVVFSDFSCNYIVIETRNGYTVAENWSFRPVTGDVLYGDFNFYGLKNVYNRSRGALMAIDVEDFWLSYFDAQDRIGWYCSQ